MSRDAWHTTTHSSLIAILFSREIRESGGCFLPYTVFMYDRISPPLLSPPGTSLLSSENMLTHG